MDGRAASFRFTTGQQAARPKGTGCNYLHFDVLLAKDMMNDGYTHQMLYCMHYKIPFQDLPPYFKTVFAFTCGSSVSLSIRHLRDP